MLNELDGSRAAHRTLSDMGQAATPQLFEDLTACPEGVQEIAEWMTDAAPRIPTEVVVGQAAVLQLFEMVNKRGDLVAGCRVTEGALQVGATGVAAALCCLQSLRSRVCANLCCRRMPALRLPLCDSLVAGCHTMRAPSKPLRRAPYCVRLPNVVQVTAVTSHAHLKPYRRGRPATWSAALGVVSTHPWRSCRQHLSMHVWPQEYGGHSISCPLPRWAFCGMER